jgi:hypothetical protein
VLLLSFTLIFQSQLYEFYINECLNKGYFASRVYDPPNQVSVLCCLVDSRITNAPQTLKPVVLIVIEHVSRQRPLFWVEEVDGETNSPKIRSIVLPTWQNHYDSHKPGAVLDSNKFAAALAAVKAAILEREERLVERSKAIDATPAAETRVSSASDARVLRSDTAPSSRQPARSDSGEQEQTNKRKKKSKQKAPVRACSWPTLLFQMLAHVLLYYF